MRGREFIKLAPIPYSRYTSPMPIHIATWNVNSIKSRLPHVLAWLKDAAPDIVLLQELKCVDEAFPAMEIEELGYNTATFGEKTYNGVAILSKLPLDDIRKGLPGNDDDTQARYIEAVVSLPKGKAMRVASVYVPNGQAVDSDKFVYKMAFLERLKTHLDGLREYEEMLVVGGDYNVALTPSDVYDPKGLDGTVCYHPEERKRLRAILNSGMYDAFRLIHSPSLPPANGGSGGETCCPFTWWDYRGGSWQMNKGMRIDYLLLSAQAADKLTDCTIARNLRDAEKASDHVPVVGSFGV